MRLTFDEQAHQYFIDGRPVPSVTQAIHDLVGVGWKADPWYLERGHVIHQAAQLLIAGRLDWSTWETKLNAALSEDKAKAIIGRVRGIEKCLRETGVVGVASEVQMGSATYRFAGTADLLARYEDENEPSICIDWKGSINPRVELQLGAYSLLYTANNNGRKLRRAVAVELSDDGNYRTLWGSRFPTKDKGMFDLQQAERIFISGLSFRGWMNGHGISNQQKEN